MKNIAPVPKRVQIPHPLRPPRFSYISVNNINTKSVKINKNRTAGSISNEYRIYSNKRQTSN